MRKIYYVDDDHDDIKLFTCAVKTLEEESNLKVDLKVYSEGIKLLNEIKKIDPENSLIFLDINMPLINGFELLVEIRKDVELCKLPIIMYSTASDSKSIQISQELGANLYAVKPYSINKIISLIKQVVEIEWDNFKFNCIEWANILIR